MICPSCSSENDDGADNCIRCGKGLFALTVGSVLSGRYDILGAVGKGGMGMVYKALDRELEETVAIKVLRAEVADATGITKRFRSEIKLARRVSHPNVCRIHEYGKEGHLAYIVMEFIEGVDLKRLIRESGRLPMAEAYEVAIQVADALQAIHNVGIVHRDLKTPNIMRDARGLVKLMDFGIAKRFEAEGATQVTATGQIVGTPEYMSPEQARAEKVDTRSDIYALGIVVFELFTGRVPFRGDTPMATLFKHLQDPPPLQGPGAAAIPPPLAPVLRQALAKDRNQRFSSAREMADALRAARDAPRAGAPAGTEVLLSAAVRKPLASEETAPLPTPAPTPLPEGAPLTSTQAGPTVVVESEGRTTVADPGRPTSPGAGSAWAMTVIGGSKQRRALAAVGIGLAILAVSVAVVRLGQVGSGTRVEPVAAPTVPTPSAAPAMDAETLAALRKVKDFEAQLAELKGQQEHAVARAVEEARKQVIEDAQRKNQTVSPEQLRKADETGRKAAEEARKKTVEEERRLEEQKRIEEQRLADAKAQEEARKKAEEATRPSITDARPAATLPPAPAVPAAATETSPEEVAVRDTLRRYVAAIEAKRLDSLKAVFPGFPEKTIRESFQFSRSIKVRLQPCDVRVDGATAVVRCQRHDDLVTSDDKTVQSDTSAWFLLKRKDKGNWVIDVIR